MNVLDSRRTAALLICAVSALLCATRTDASPPKWGEALPGIVRANGLRLVKLSEYIQCEELKTMDRDKDIQRTVRADEAAALYGMRPHEENGQFVERHPEHKGSGRAPSGCIYYYLAPKEASQFHVIDCGEYWVWSAGEPIETWEISPSGELTRRVLGIGEGMEPVVYFAPGVIFGARHRSEASDGTFVTCITVPRFQYEGWRLVLKDEIARLCPDALRFFD